MPPDPRGPGLRAVPQRATQATVPGHLHRLLDRVAQVPAAADQSLRSKSAGAQGPAVPAGADGAVRLYQRAPILKVTSIAGPLGSRSSLRPRIHSGPRLNLRKPPVSMVSSRASRPRVPVSW